MSARPLASTGLVLDRAPAGEQWTRLTIFDPEHGALVARQRLARRTAAAAPPADLFDESRFLLESRNEGRTWFVREAVPLRRRPGLGASYAVLQAACRLARVITANPLHDESRPAVYELLTRALDAWENGARPDAVYFKSIYLLARHEGYPVREEWEEQLPAASRDRVGLILRQPATAQTTAPAAVQALTEALEAYLRDRAEMRFA